MDKPQKMLLFYEWDDSSIKKPSTLRQLAKDLGVSEVSLHNWRAKRNSHTDNGYDSTLWLQQRTPQADEALFQSIKKGNAQSIKIFYNLLDRLKEKKEEKVAGELNAEDIRNLIGRAEAELREGGYRDVEVPKQSPILPDELRFHSEQEHGEEN